MLPWRLGKRSQMEGTWKLMVVLCSYSRILPLQSPNFLLMMFSAGRPLQVLSSWTVHYIILFSVSQAPHSCFQILAILWQYLLPLSTTGWFKGGYFCSTYFIEQRHSVSCSNTGHYSRPVKRHSFRQSCLKILNIQEL